MAIKPQTINVGIICIRIRVKPLLCADGDNQNMWPNGVRQFVKTIW